MTVARMRKSFFLLKDILQSLDKSHEFFSWVSLLLLGEKKSSEEHYRLVEKESQTPQLFRFIPSCGHDVLEEKVPAWHEDF